MSSSPRPSAPPDTLSPTDPKLTVSSGLTIRAVLLGILLSILLTMWTIHSGYVTHASNISVTHLPVAAMFPFVFIVLILNPLMKLARPGSGLKRQELIVVFFLIFTASAIPGWAFSTYALSIISGPHYFASTENRWAELFLDYLAPWLVLPDDGGSIQWFFEGSPPGQPMPWHVWVIPLFWWGTFYLAIFIVSASVMVILRKQWVEHERLTFPLARVPLMLVEGTTDQHWLPGVAQNRLFWFGFTITAAVLGWNIISFFGDIPPVPVGPSYSLPFTIAKSFPAITLKLNFLLLGVAYFTRVEVLLSIWLFFLLRVIEEGVMARVGVPAVRPLIQAQHFAGFAVYVLFGIWLARKHLAEVWRKAIGKESKLDDSREFFSYRTAVFGAILGLLYMLFWLHTAGMSLMVGALMLFVLMILYLGVTRVVAETGLVSLDLPASSANEVTVQFVGSANISPETLTTMWLSQTYSRNWRTLGMVSIAHCAKVGDQTGGVGKGVFGAITVALGLSFLTSVVYTMYLGYDGGASQFTEPAWTSGAEGYWNGLAGLMQNPKTMTGGEVLFYGVGAAVSGLLIFGHYRFPWWPLHPVGFGIVFTHSANMGVFSIFLIWIVKSFLLRLGGVQFYKKIQPAIIGMLSAYSIMVFMSWLVDEIWFPGNGHLVDDW
ncbi:MAG: DUF6785 family protein [Gemmatimonadota bacterium]|nr:DUF6785 family protein [Gemmatimonadota bacterium]